MLSKCLSFSTRYWSVAGFESVFGIGISGWERTALAELSSQNPCWVASQPLVTPALGHSMPDSGLTHACVG